MPNFSNNPGFNAPDTEHEKEKAYILDLKTNPLKPCVYLDNGGLRRLSFTKYKSEVEAKLDWGNKFCYWPETNPKFYEVDNNE